MKASEQTRQIIISHYQKYPCAQIEDFFKLLHQSAFGCEHLLSSEDAACEYIYKEFLEKPRAKELTCRLDGNFSRVHLSVLEKGLDFRTLGRLFFLSANEKTEDKVCLEEKISVLKELIKEGALPFDPQEFEVSLSRWQKNGYRPLHHSELYRKKYAPAYRVISNKYVKYLELFSKIDTALKGGKVLLAVDGRCASGKTTLAEILKEVYDLNVFHMDDFFLRPEQRTKERFLEIGGNIDHERFKCEVLEPLKKGGDFAYQKFDCSKMELLPPTEARERGLNLIEGVYSMHPELLPYYDLTVLLDVSPSEQRERILRRNPKMADRFFSEFIPLEEKYFLAHKLRDKCDIYIEN